MMLQNLDYYVLAEAITCFFSLLLTVNIFFTLSLKEFRQQLFCVAGIACFLYTFFNVASAICITYYKTTPLWVCNMCSTLFFIFLIYFPCIFSFFAADIAYSGKRERFYWLLVNDISFVLYLIVVFINLKTGWIFRYDRELGYIRGPLKYLSYMLSILYVFESLAVVAINRKSMTRRLRLIFVFYPIVSFIVICVQILISNKILLSGTAGYSALLFAYLTIQADMIDYDFSTGLLTEKKLEKRVTNKSQYGYLYVISIDNLSLLQMHMSIRNYNQLILEFGNIFTATFPRNAFHTNTNRFSAIVNSEKELRKCSDIINNFIDEINIDFDLPFQMEIYSVATELAIGSKSFGNITDIINNMLSKAKLDQNRELVICDDSILLDMERKKLIFNILKRELTLDSNQFEVWYQPIWSIKEKRFTYMEALSRLRNTEIGDISPQEFVEVAESKGLIEELGFVAFQKVCKFISENKDCVEAVSINFSVYQMTNPNIVHTVLDTIEKFNLSPSSIIMEITESIFIDNYELVFRNMKKLSEAGIKFYLDDFGTGYSNLSNVIGLPFSTIKIDRSIVLMMEENKKNTNFVINLISTFKDSGFKILVEGVETQNQNDLVQKAGIDYIQGFLYSRPQSPERCLEILKRNF